MNGGLNHLIDSVFVNSTDENAQNSKDRKPCGEKSCVKNIPLRLPPLRRVNQKDEDEWEIRALPSDWVPVTRVSGITERIMKKKKEEHERFVDEMKNQREAVNLEVELRIRAKAEELKASLSETKFAVREILDAVDARDEGLILKLTKADYENSLAKILALQTTIKEKINDYHQFLRCLEKQRAEEYKRILRQAYKSLHQVSYKLPHELQQYFEHEILTINQIILANLRCYSELRLQLILQVENGTRIWSQELAAKKEAWKYAYKKTIIQELYKSKIGINMREPNAVFQMTSEDLSNTEINMESMCGRNIELPITNEQVDLWSFAAQKNIDDLDDVAKNLVNLYKAAVVRVFHGYFDELKEVGDQLVDMEIASDQSEVHAISKQICEPEIEAFEQNYTIKINELEKLWTSVLNRLHDKIRKTYSFLRNSAHLWDSHFQRVEDAKSLVLKELNNTIKKNDRAVQAQEIRMNVMLDVLRQQSDENKLNATMDSLVELMDDLRNTYNSHFKAEVKIVEKFTDLSKAEVEILSVELQHFLDVHPKETHLNLNIKRSSLNIIPEADELGHLIPKQMKMCEYQVEAVHNWMFGLWEAIEKYRQTCKDELAEKTAKWVGEQVKKVGKRLEVKLAVHEPRYQRAKMDIYDVRLAELRLHRERFERHKAGVEEEIVKLKYKHKQYEELYQDLLDKYKSRCEKILNSLGRTRTHNVVVCHASELKKMGLVCGAKLDEMRNAYEQLCKEKVDLIKESGIKFNQEIRLFSEDGNFSPDEAKATADKLKKFEKTVKKLLKGVQKEADKSFKKISFQIKQSDQEISKKAECAQKEVVFDKKTEEVMNQTQKIVSDHVLETRSSIGAIKQEVKGLFVKGFSDLGQAEHLNNFIDVWMTVSKKMANFASYLYLPDNMPIVNRKRKISRQSSLVLTKSKSKSSSAVNGSKKSKINLKDYTKLLYDEIPEDSNNFMSKLCNYIHDSFACVSAEAQAFYTEHEDLKTEGSTLPSYDDCMEQMLRKYQHYHLQCELVWLEQVNSFLKVMDQMFEFVTQYCDDFVYKYYQINRDAYQKVHEEFIENVSKLKASNDEKFETVYKKLKPLHGHPNNKALLETLQGEMNALLNEIRDNIVNLIPPYKESKQESCRKFDNDFSAVASALCKLKEISTIDPPNIKLLEQMETRLTLLEDELENEEDASGETSTNKNKSEIGISKRLSDYKRRLNIPSDYRMDIQWSKSLLEKVSSGIPRKASALGIDELSTFPPSLTNTLDLMPTIEKLIQDYHAFVEGCAAQLDKIEVAAIDNEVKWTNLWAADVNRILRLYQVKWDFGESGDENSNVNVRRISFL